MSFGATKDVLYRTYLARIRYYSPTVPKLCLSLGRLYAYTKANVEHGVDRDVTGHHG